MTRGRQPKRKQSTKTRVLTKTGSLKKRAAQRSPSSRADRPRKATGHPDDVPLRVPSHSILTGGDLDADQQRAWDSGDEAVGGSVATPDQDVVDELGRALGVEQELDDEVRTADEILHERDRRRWKQEE